MKTKPLMLLFYALVPIIVIIILFKIDTIVGLIGIVTFLLLIIVVNRNLIYRLKAQLEYGKGNLDNSIKWFAKAANAKKVKADVLVNYGFVLLKSGKLDESNKYLQRLWIKAVAVKRRTLQNQI